MPDMPRVCGGCTLCCRVMGVAALQKGRGVECPHVQPGKGCGVYDSRPESCGAYVCGWLISPALDETWRPDICGFMVHLHQDLMILEVDPLRPNAWRQPPYYQQLKLSSRRVFANKGGVLAIVGSHALAILPDEDLDLGERKEQDSYLFASRATDGLRQITVSIRRADGSVRVFAGEWRKIL